MSKQITVIIKKPGEDAYVDKIESSLASMQAVVGGMIELLGGQVVGLSPIIDIWFNEEGKLMQLEPNLGLVCRGRLFDVLVGTAFFTTHDEDGGTTSLPPEFHKEVFKFCDRHALCGER